MTDLISRGVKRPSPLGTTIFVSLRILDVFFQYTILVRGLAGTLPKYLYIPTPDPNDAPPALAANLPLKSLVVLAMAALASLKQIYWLTYTSNEELQPPAAIAIAIFNTVFNSANSLLSLTTAATAFTPTFLTTSDSNGLSPLLLLGSVVFLLGVTTEALSETQRKAFKNEERNNGKVFTGGLFGLARHVNYGGYVIWRGAYALVSGGWIWGAIVAGCFVSDFVNRGIPALDAYCVKRYGASWAEYKKKVPYQLIPGVY